MKNSVFQSKVARRIFTLLLTAALIPIAIMAALSLNHVESVTEEQIKNSLRQETKLFGLSVYERLIHIDDKLQFYTSVLRSGHTGEVVSDRDQIQISGLVYTDTKNGESVLFGLGQNIPSFSSDDMKHMEDGNTLISTIYTKGISPQLYMSRLVDSNNKKSGIVSAQINKTYLWGDNDLFASDKSLCIFTTELKYLHCSGDKNNPLTKSATNGSVIDQQVLRNLGNDQSYFNGRWRLFLKARFAMGEWNIILSQSRESALSSSDIFSYNYILIILMALILVILISINLIRRSTKPIEALTNGIKHLSENRFDSEVIVESKDEYRDVADAFNNMSNKIGNQIERLHTLAEIDQLILSRPNIDDIIKIAIEGIENSTTTKWTGIAIALNDKNKTFRLFGKARSEPHIVKHNPVKISDSGISSIYSGNLDLDLSNNKKFLGLFNNLAGTPCNSWTAFPILIVDEPPAILITGNNTKPAFEEISYIKELASRIAVAFSNASWEEKLYYQAHYDNLTNLPNRLLMHDRLEQELKHTRRANEFFSILFLDLDRFKNVNDSIGHEYGDMLLQKIGKRIESCIRQDDTVARLGGDEFVILIRSLDSEEKALGISSLIAEKIISEISKPVSLNQHEGRITARLGIVISPNDGDSADILLRNADSAMYHAKDNGRGNFQFYSDEMNKSARYRLDMEAKLHRAIENEEFIFHYQPKINPTTNKITSAEALLRWVDNSGEMIFPDKYIHIAEDIGLTTIIGKWGLKVVCNHLINWNRLVSEPLMVSINISPQHFLHGDLVGHVEDALNETGLDPTLLELEITETTAMNNIKHTVSIMEKLREKGVHISIDDFGTGYSSLNHLKHFPAYALKIDRSFVSQITLDQRDMAIVKSTMVLAHNLGLKVIAEGVETHEQFQALVSMDCDEMQGYLFSKPVPEEEFRKMIMQEMKQVVEI